MDAATPTDDTSEINREIVERICQPFILDNEIYKNIKDTLLDDIKFGLCKHRHHKAAVKCYPTYVSDLPTGCERGKYLAVDLGGSSLRVLLVYLLENHIKVESASYDIPSDLLMGSGTQLFDHIAQSLSAFMKKYEIASEELPLGFTFPFPTKHISVDKGYLAAWTNGYYCSGVVNREVVGLLRDAIERKNIKIGDICILNDTTSTLMTCAWTNRSTQIGLIIATGCNACYMEKTKHIQIIEKIPNAPANMIINCEWGAFGNNGKLDFIRTDIDKSVDEESINPGKQIFEKMVAGMYLGEIARRIILACIEEKALFKGNFTLQIRHANTFPTKYLSQIEAQEPDKHKATQEILQHLGYKNAAEEDCKNVRYICEAVSTRSAHLIAACTACLIDRVGDPFTVVAVDGGLYRNHPHFHNRLACKIRQLARGEHKFDIIHAQDGSSRGAAVLAGILNKKHKKTNSKC